MADLDLTHIPRLLVFNKEDKVDGSSVSRLRKRFGGISISAINRSTLLRLLSGIEAMLWKEDHEVRGS